MKTYEIAKETIAVARDDRPEVSTEERRKCNLIKRIRKLRWLGMDDAADALIQSQVMAGARNTFLAVPADTD